MENRPWKLPVPLADFYGLQTQNYSHQPEPEQSRSLAIIHTPRLWDDKALDYAWLRGISKLTPGTGQANLQSSQCAGTCVKQGTFLLPWRWTRDSDCRRRESRHSMGPYFCAWLAHTQSAQVALRRWVRWTVGSGQFPMLEFTATFF